MRRQIYHFGIWMVVFLAKKTKLLWEIGNILVETHHETTQAPFMPLISVTDMASNGSIEKYPHDRIYIA